MAAILVAAQAGAQDSVATVSDSAPPRFAEASVGYSWYSPQANHLGVAGFRRVYLTELRTEWGVRRHRWFRYMVTAVPVAVVERTTGTKLYCRRDPRRGEVCGLDKSARASVGTGITPFGVKMLLDPHGAVRLYGSAGAGFLVFSRDVPVDSTRRFNFTFEYGVGLEVPYAKDRAVAIGYKFHHISNAHTARVNPGLDANVLYVGVRRLVPRRAP